MKAHPVLRIALTAVSSLALAAPSVHAIDFGKANPLSWFKEKEVGVPSVSEKQAQEASAELMLRDAKTAASTGSTGKAQSIYKDIVSRYRFTDAASTAQYEYAKLVRADGKLQAAFDGFQKFINDYRQSPYYNDAIQQQFEIAEEARGGRKQGSLLFIPMKMDKSAIIKMYQAVISNSPYGKYAPYAQFAIGEVYQDDGDKVNANAAFQAVVDNHSNTKLASEAQFRIGAIASAAASRTQDASNLTTTRDALEIYRAAHPTGERSGEAEALLNQVNEAQSLKSLEIAKFYETSGKPKAAAIYYNEAIRFGAADAALEARERLANLAALYPDEIKENAAIEKNSYTVQAASNLKTRDDYSGPPAPVVARMGPTGKPEMRVEQDDFKPIPLQEPDLPTRPANQPQPGMLLPPAEGNKTPAPLAEPDATLKTPELVPTPSAPPTPPAPAVEAPVVPPVPPAPPVPAAPAANP